MPARADGCRGWWTGALPALEYPDHFLVTRVTNAGTIRFKTRLLYLSTASQQHRIGLEEVDGIWSLYFSNVLPGRIDERTALMKGQLGVTHVPGCTRREFQLPPASLE